MRSSVRFENRLIMLEEMENDSTFQILEYSKLQGTMDTVISQSIEAINRAGGRLKQVRIVLDDNAIKIEPGAVSYIKGAINKKNKSNRAFSLGKKLISSRLSSEIDEEKPIIEGRGEIFLEPSFNDYALLELEDEEIVIKDGLFLACEETVEVKSIINGAKNEVILRGSGIVVLELPVPCDEIFKCKLYNDTLKIDGDFVILRGGNVEHSSEVSDIVCDNGIMNVYKGIGDVWLVPTKEIYSDIRLNNGIDMYDENN